MGCSFKIRSKSANGFGIKEITVNGNNDAKKISEFITTSIKEDFCALAGAAVVETVFQHNLRVIFQTAMFFQRVVSRTPKDERYRDANGRWHEPDDDYVWKYWTIEYNRKKLTADRFGEVFFDNGSDSIAGNHFNNKTLINWISEQIMESLFGGFEALWNKPKRIRQIHINNTHPRFAQLEYGQYKYADTKQPVKGPNGYWHGVRNGYSIQAPYGMLRITQAEMSTITMSNFESYMKNFSRYNNKVTRVPSKSKMKRLVKLIEDKTHLSARDIDAIAEVYTR